MSENWNACFSQCYLDRVVRKGGDMMVLGIYGGGGSGGIGEIWWWWWWRE